MTTANLDNVQDGLGSAAEIPRAIASLASSKKKEREAAFVELSDERLVHQGTQWPAAVPAVALLVDALRAAKHPGRSLVLATLAHVAVAHPPSFATDASAQTIADLLADDSLAGACYRAVRAAADDVAAHLTSKNAPTRAEAAALLALIAPERASAHIDPHRERDDELCTSLLLARAVALRLNGSVNDLGAVDTSSDLIRTAHHIAAGLLDLPVEAADLAPALSPPLSDVQTPYGPLDRLAVRVAIKLGEAALPLLTTALRSSPPNASRTYAIARAVLVATFPACATDGDIAPLVSADSLTPIERAVLELLVTTRELDSWGPLSLLHRVGISGYHPTLRAFLGLDPPGPREARVVWRGTTVEAFLVVDAVARGDVSEDEARTALSASLSADDRADLALRISQYIYGLVRRPAWTMERADAFACSLLDDPATWPRIRAHIRAYQPKTSHGPFLLLAAWLRHGTDDDVDHLAPIFHHLKDRNAYAFLAKRYADAQRAVTRTT